jgi:hypothetical protein
MKPKFKQYRFVDLEDLGQHPAIAIENFKQEFEIKNIDKIRVIKKSDAVYVFEDELNIQIETVKRRTDKEFLNEKFEEGYLAGNRAFERYSFFKIEVSNLLTDGKSIQIDSEIENGVEYLKCKKYKDWLIPELYLCSIVAGIKGYCIKNKISNLKFRITDLELNIYTSHHTSYYAVEIFLDKFLKPRIKKEA